MKACLSLGVSIALALASIAPGVASADPGALDLSFGGGDGVVTSNVGAGTNAAVNDLVLMPDGRIAAVGRAQVGGGTVHFASTRYQADGKPDFTWLGDGTPEDGVLETDFTGAAHSAIPLPDTGPFAEHKLLIAGGTNSPANWQISRYLVNGQRDEGFNGDGAPPVSDGRVRYGGFNIENDLPIRALARQPDGKLVAVGTTGPASTAPKLTVMRFLENGAFDTGFDGDGVFQSSFNGSASDVVLLPDGSIVVAGFQGTFSDSDLLVAKLTSKGALDTGFDGDGRAVVSFGATVASLANAIVLQPDGKLAVAGVADANPAPGTQLGSFAIARFQPDGSPDPTFAGPGGSGSTPFGAGTNAIGNDLVLQADGKLQVVGSVDVDPGAGIQERFAIARYLPGGGLDPTFDGDGNADGLIVGQPVAGKSAFATSALALPDGRLLVGGSADGDFAVAMYQGNLEFPSSETGVGTATSAGGGPADERVEGARIAILSSSSEKVDRSGLLRVRIALGEPGRVVLRGGLTDDGFARFKPKTVRFGARGVKKVALRLQKLDRLGDLERPLAKIRGDARDAAGNAKSLSVKRRLR